MSRVVSQTLLDAIQNQQGETILRVKTWLNLAAYNAAPTVPEQTWQTNKFKIEGTEAEAALISETNDYTVSDFTVFLIERGVSISGVEYVTQSGLYFVSKFEEKAGRINIKGSSFPDQKIVIDGDDTYENVITAFCTEIGKTAVFKDTGAAWLSYQFLPAGKQVILNKAERFLNLIRQKYLIQCYERSPKELVFYHAATEQSNWKDIIYASSQLVLTATGGSSEISISTDGVAFTKINASGFTNAVTYSPSLDLFAAVGDNLCMTSPDGITWTTRTIPTGSWKSITWDATTAKFVAVASDSAIAYSSNGVTWTQISNDWTQGSWSGNAPTNINSVCWSPELSLFVMVGSNTLSTMVYSSTDGITWTPRTAANTGSWTDVCWSPELGLFVAVAASSSSRVMTSTDGINWTSRTAAEANIWISVCWSPELSLFVAVSANGTNRVMTSSNGTSWTARSAAEANTWSSVCWSPSLSLFVAVSSDGTNRVMTSSNGTSWTARSAAEANNWTNVCWSPTLSLFVAVSSNGTNRVMTSSNGTSWTARSAASANSWVSVIWCEEISAFIAMGLSGTSSCMYSFNGTSWTSLTTPNFSGSIGTGHTLAWSPALTRLVFAQFSLFYYNNFNNPFSSPALSTTQSNSVIVAVGVSKAFSSTNATEWIERTIPAGTYNKIIYADSLFVAVGASKCATSPDGITWTERTIPAGTYTALAYSPTLDLFLAMGDNLAATSPDGITWTSRTAPADQAWQAVTWADDLAQFIAVSSEGDNRIASSTDGINWQILTAQADYSLSYLDGPTSSILHGTNTVHYISRDESSAVNTEGDTSYPAWNLGYLESTASAPATNTDPFYKFFLQKAPLRLDITDGDRIHFEPSWTLDPTLPIDAMVTIIEVFDSTKSPAWYQEIRSLALFDSVEGGSLPSTIERVAAYTPLVSSGFDGNLTPEVNNLQALAEAVDDLNIAGGSIPATTAANDFQVGDGAGAWVKKTFAQTITILRTSLDTIYQALDSDLTAIAGLSPTNDDIIQRKSGSWVNRTLAQLATDMTELIQDIVGAMLTGNTETNITVTYQDSDGTIDFEVTGGSGGAYSSVSSQSVTTSNISAAEGKFYNLDLSGLTADRDFTLPTPSAAGKFIGLRVNVGDATYELLVKRNGSEVTRVFISGETLEFVSTGTGAGDWIVFRDGRIPSFCILERQSAQSVASSSYPVKIQLTTKVTDIGDIGDAVTNYRITARRANKYNILGVVIFANSFSNQSNVQSLVHVNNALDTYQITYISTTLTNQPGMARAPYERSLASGDYVELIGYHNQGVAVNTGTTVGYPHLSIKEILEPL